MKVKLNSEEELELMAKELLHILFNLRHWTKEWSEHYGGGLLIQKKRWEKRADDYLAKMQMTKTNQVGEIKINIEPAEKNND